MSEHHFAPSLGSDNHAEIHPKVLDKILQVNQSHAPSYGTDGFSKSLQASFTDLFQTACHSFFVFNGTAANVLSVRSLIPSWQSAICSDVSHLYHDECGAVEFVSGRRLLVVPSKNGKISPLDIEPLLIRGGDQHYSYPGMISITQPTELGTVYSFEEMAAIRSLADQFNMKIHVDGARLANSLISLDCSFADLYSALKPDAISFGGTKNGLMGAEAVLLFDSELAKNFKFIRKQCLQLPSKTRFLAAQFAAYFENDLYREIASHTHAMACRLREGLSEVNEAEVLYPVESNAVFVKIPKSWTKPLREVMFFYVWDERDWSVRLMPSFSTTHEQIDEFLQTAKALSGGHR